MRLLNSFAFGAARKALNASSLKPYGAMTKLEIDNRKKSIFLVLELKGESQPVEIEVLHYELVQRDGGTYLEVNHIKTSREWLNTLLSEHLLENVLRPWLRENPLPAMIRMLL